MIKYRKRRAGGISDRKLIRTEDAVGQVLCHDMTQIIKDKYKDTRFRKGHVVTEAAIPLLLSMGKEHLYPLVNSLRIAAISAVVVFFAGIAAAYYIAKFPRLVKGVLDVGAGDVRYPADDDLVVSHLRHSRGRVPADVPHSTRRV